jgi:hypothetical protein
LSTLPETHELPDNLPTTLRALVDYWRGECDRLGRVPSMAEFNLMDIYKIAPRLFIGDRILSADGHVRYRWRYWGTTLCTFVGADLTGKYLDETHDEKAHDAAIKYYDWALENNKPQYFRQTISVRGAEHTYWEYERVIVPLTDQDRQAQHIVGVYVSEHEDHRQLTENLPNQVLH